MKRFLLTLSLLVCMQSTLSAHFYENLPEVDVIRVFVLPDNVKLTQSGIYLDLGNGQSILKIAAS